MAITAQHRVSVEKRIIELHQHIRDHGLPLTVREGEVFRHLLIDTVSILRQVLNATPERIPSPIQDQEAAS